MMFMKKIVMGSALAMLFTAGAASAADAVFNPLPSCVPSATQVCDPGAVRTFSNNFTMVNADNSGSTGGNNSTTFSWNQTFRTAVVTDGTYNATLSSGTTFSGSNWIAHNMNIYAPGSYSFNTAGATGNPGGTSSAMYNMTVGANQVGAHMLFDWGATDASTACGKANCNIDVVVVWALNKSWADVNAASPWMVTSATNTTTKVWSGVSVDTNMDPDNFAGTKMIDGPFVGQSANFNIMGLHAAPVSAVPVPAAAWLLGSGLIGLVGVARRRKSA